LDAAADSVRVALLLAQMPEKAAHHAAEYAVGDRERRVVGIGARESLRADVQRRLQTVKVGQTFGAPIGPGSLLRGRRPPLPVAQGIFVAACLGERDVT
jgi:hypothetical protein